PRWAASRRRIRAQAEWNVDTHIFWATGPTRSPTRSFISSAALLVKVMARMAKGETLRSLMRWATRWVSTRVLPDPAPATTRIGPPGWVTASRWTGFSPSSREDGFPGGSGSAVIAPPSYGLGGTVESLPQHVLLDLPGTGQGKGVEEDPVDGCLVGREVLPAQGEELGFGRLLGAGRHPDEGRHDLAPPLVGDADDGALGHRRMLEQHVLDLPGIDVLAAPDDHVLQPALDADVAAPVHRGQVAGVVPAVGVDGPRRGLGHVVVAGHDEVAPAAQLADLADGGHLAGAGVDDLHLGLGQRAAERRRPVGRIVVEGGLGEERRALGRSEDDRERHAEGVLDPPHELGRHHGTSGDDGADAGQVPVGEVGMLEYGDEHRRDAQHHGTALAL